MQSREMTCQQLSEPPNPNQYFYALTHTVHTRYVQLNRSRDLEIQFGL